ncbi:hypothetical protein LP419_30915 [Massilia sp. H-1]|nr:hypothetical protein LP419_30915 [Massilia sp. H-1]
MKIRAYLALMVAAILIPVILFSTISLNMLLKSERDAALKGVRETARISLVSIDRELTNTESVLRMLANSPYLASADLARLLPASPHRRPSRQHLDRPARREGPAAAQHRRPVRHAHAVRRRRGRARGARAGGRYAAGIESDPRPGHASADRGGRRAGQDPGRHPLRDFARLPDRAFQPRAAPGESAQRLAGRGVRPQWHHDRANPGRIRRRAATGQGRPAPRDPRQDHRRDP